ncbi:hypothetical protein [Ensifer aridi]|uniref:hypothetical protein n=1 Tax=Ensifer aridi TaxID=1708715 RepID=UPI000A113871|nr:hypothetical protein [Ensifer aridi]
MPQALGAIALAIFQAGGPIWLSNALVGVGALGGIFGAVGQIALSFGLSALAGAIFRPRQQSTRPEDVQQSVRVAAADRVVIYGQFQATGNWIFGDSKSGDLHKVLAVCEGKLVTVLNLKIDDNIVTVNGSGVVTSSPYDGAARFLYRRGLPTETHYSELTSVFPEWNSAHRGDGVVTIYATQYALEADEVTNVFPSLKDTLFRIEGRFTEIWNPVTGVTAWSDNAAGVIRHFIVSRNGMRIPETLLTTPLAQDAWEIAWNVAATAIALKGGGTEPRYRLWGAYKLSETPGAVLEAMLANCDAQPILTRDGGMAIRIGTAPTPTVTLDRTLITAAVRIASGVDVRTTANRISSKYLSQNDDYLLVDADPWVDDEDISARGEIADAVDWTWTPSHGQARRLMKLRYHRLTPRWTMTVNCRLGALAAFQEQFVNVDYTIGDTQIAGVFEVLEFTWNLGDNGILRSVTLTLQSVNAGMYSWDPLTEEGTAPVTADVTVDREIPMVTGFAAAVGRREISSGQTVAYAILTFNAPPASLTVQIQGKKVSDTVWLDVNVPRGETTIDGLLMDDGAQYEFRARHMSLRGRVSNWTTPTIKLTAVADPTPPAALTSFALTSSAPHLGNASFSIVTPNDAHLKTVKLYRKATGVALDVDNDTPIATLVVGTLSTYGYTDGDATRTNLFSNPGFDSDTVWTKGAGWTIASGKATHAAGSANSITQAVTLTPVGTVFRYQFDVLDLTAGSVFTRFNGGTVVNGVARTANGTYRGTMTSVAGNTAAGFNESSTFVGSVDNAILYPETASCAPQGVWDYYAVPFNGSNVDGPASGPVTVTVI